MSSYEDLNNLLTPAPNVEVTSAWGQQIRDNFEFMTRDAPSVCVASSTGTSVGDATDVQLTADTERWDTDSMFTPTGTAIAINTAGFYTVRATVSFPSNGTGYRLGQLLKNGSVSATLFCAAGFAGQTNTISSGAALSLVVGDYLEVRVYQTSTTTLTVTLAEFSALWTRF